jgi:hypothetical protein
MDAVPITPYQFHRRVAARSTNVKKAMAGLSDGLIDVAAKTAAMTSTT